MSTIRYPDDESVAEITARYLLAMPAGLLPMLYGFLFDGKIVHSDCVGVDLGRDRGTDDPNPIHLKAAYLRKILGPGMFGFGFTFPVFSDQLDDLPRNRHIPAPVRAAAEQLPTAYDLIAAVTIDATGRQWWAVVPRQMPGLDPILLRLPATPSENWRIPESLDASLWTAALALDDDNHAALLRLRTTCPDSSSAR
ncbi:hypothetical protein [Nocardia sp. NPDC019395]|uniref:hypothetical protein n=1 Tax=Nocardia sp. NPDC019395 TaxID=3154686 RepID=UPI00340BA1C0